MRKTDLEAIRGVIHRVRNANHPSLDLAFLDAVLDAEAAALDDDAGALRVIRAHVDEVLERAGQD